MVRKSFLAIVASAALVWSPAAMANDPPEVRPVVVDVAPGAAADADAVRAAVSRELQAPTMAPGPNVPGNVRGVLHIELDAQRRLVISYRDASGREIFRTVTVPNDPVAAIATISFIAGNLARDEASELLMAMSAPPAVPPVAPAPVMLPPPPPVIVPPVIEPPTEPQPTAVIAPPPAMAPVVHVSGPVPGSERPRLHPVNLGLEVFASGLAGVGANSGFLVFGAASASYTIGRHFTIGLNQIHAGGGDSPNGMRGYAGAAPFIEAFRFVRQSSLQTYADAGVAIQQRWGAGSRNAVGIAPFAGVGLRYWLGNRFSVGLGVRVHYVANNGYAASWVVLPQGSIMVSGGIELAVHL